ncbi:MAG: cyclic nucleotide-binding domain-containing protein [Myxococcales bacterium]|nr:cyclic nucleotide-binding domain-containing protein [Myxococcales bacterium]
MSTALTTTVHDPHALTAAQRDALSTELFAVHGHIFAGVDEATFRRYVVDSDADHTRIAVYRTPAGEAVGYAALHVFRERLAGRPCAVVRCETGLRRAWRGQSVVAPFVARTIVAWRLRHPGLPMYGFACPVHPASYLAVVRQTQTAWPRVDRPTPPAIEALMHGLADRFHLPAVPGADPGVRDVGWVSRSAPAELAWWASAPQPEARYYTARNPGFAAGHGLLLLVPLGLGHLLRIAGLVAQRRARLALLGLRARLDRRGPGRRLPSTDPGQVPLPATLARADVQDLLEASRRVAVGAGQWICREGEAGDDAFVLLTGTACVYRGDDEHTVVHQLRVGDLFGEIAPLQARPRCASVRAARPCEVLRIPGAALAATLRAHPEAAQAIEATITRVLAGQTQLPDSATLSRG